MSGVMTDLNVEKLRFLGRRGDMTDFIGPLMCAGVVTKNPDGTIKYRFACEVHLFTASPCGWQLKAQRQPYNRNT